MPSVMSMEHQRQAAIYAKGSKMDVKFLYITPKKTQFLECEDVAGTLAEIKDILNRQERFLRLGDKDMLAGIVHYDPSTFYWNGQACNPADWGKAVKKRLNL